MLNPFRRKATGLALCDCPDCGKHVMLGVWGTKPIALHCVCGFRGTVERAELSDAEVKARIRETARRMTGNVNA